MNAFEVIGRAVAAGRTVAVTAQLHVDAYHGAHVVRRWNDGRLYWAPVGSGHYRDCSAKAACVLLGLNSEKETQNVDA